MYIDYTRDVPVMPKGLKQTSDVVQISARVNESAANTFTQETVSLDLNPLDNEVFVVVAIDLNPTSPDAIDGTNTITTGCLSFQSRTSIGFVDSNNVLASHSKAIRAADFAQGGVAFEDTSLDTPPAALDYIGIIATSDFFISVQGTGNNAAGSMSARMWGYRARADSSVYAALVQSQVLSN